MLIQGSFCQSGFGNTGVSKCGYDLEQLKGIILMDKSKTYDLKTYATQAALMTVLQADAIKDKKGERIYPYLYVKGAVDATADNSIKESLYGDQVDVFHEQPRWTVTLDERGIKSLANFDKFRLNKDLAVVAVFQGNAGNDVLMFVNADGVQKGANCSVYANKAVLAGKNKGDKTITIAFEDHDLFLSDVMEFLPLSAGTKLRNSLSGIHDVKIVPISATGTAIVVKVLDAHNDTDLGEMYEDELEQNGAWSLALASTGANVAITSVTYNAVAHTFTFAGTFTLATHWLTLAAPSVLAGLTEPFGNGITGGFESTPVAITPA